MQPNFNKIQTLTAIADQAIEKTLRHPARMCLSVLLTGLALASFMTTPASAQDSGVRRIGARGAGRAQAIRHTLPEARIPASSIQVHKRPAIPFKPLPMVDPKTGKSVSPDTMLTLPSGKQMTARDLYAQLNDLEQKMNAMGYSLRDPEKKVVIQESLVNRAKLQQQKTALALKHGTPASGTPVMDRYFTRLKTLLAPRPSGARIVARPLSTTQIAQSLRAINAQALQVNWTSILGHIISVNPPPPNEIHESQTWDPGVLGDPNTFAAYVHAQFNMDGTVNATSIHGEFIAGGSLLGNSFEGLRVTGDESAPAQGSSQQKFDVYVFGNNVYDFTHSGDFAKTDTFDQPWDTSATWHGSIGPIPVSATIGTRGDAGFNYGYIVATGPAPVNANVPGALFASGYVEPFVHTSGYADAGVDIGVASAGVGANLTFINDDLLMGGQAAINFDANNRPYFHVATSANNNLDMLDGNFYLFAKVDLWLYSHEWDWTLFSWSGFQSQTYLWDEEKNLYVFGQ